jgi:hypothetical protein
VHNADSSLQDFAYLYPEPYWSADQSDSIKTLLLFFDGVVTLLPQEMKDPSLSWDQPIGGAMRERGLLKNLDPDKAIDQVIAPKLFDAVDALVQAGAFDGIDKYSFKHDMWWSRFGRRAEPVLSAVLVEELKDRGLVATHGDLLYMSEELRTTILCLLARLISGGAALPGIRLSPTTLDTRHVEQMLGRVGLASAPSTGQMISLDLEVVTYNLASVPLDDVLAFRDEHGLQFRAYRRHLARSLRELEAARPEERFRLIDERRQELADHASDLRQKTRTRLIRPLGKAALGIVGAAWNIATGDLTSAVISAAQGLIEGFEPLPNSPYSYLFEIDKWYGDRHIAAF